MKWIFVLLSLGALMFQNQRGNLQTLKGIKCLRVKDGDTIEIRLKGKKHAIRLAYIDAPEIEQVGIDGMAWGKFAKVELKKLIGTKLLTIKIIGRDFFGRYLGEIYKGKKMLNLALVESGLAIIYPYSTFGKVQDKFAFWSAMEKAKNGRRGQWSASKFLNPRYFRKRKRVTSNTKEEKISFKNFSDSVLSK